jgi:hypothetical protein
VAFGLSNNILPFFPICHQLSPPSLNLSSFFLCSNFVTVSFLLCGVVSPTPNPNLEDQGIPFLSRSSPLTCLAWEALPVASVTANIALGIMWPHKPHHYVKVGIPSGGGGVERYWNIKFYENRSSGSRFVPWGRIDTTKVIVTFCNFVNAPKSSNKMWHKQCVTVNWQIIT